MTPSNYPGPAMDPKASWAGEIRPLPYPSQGGSMLPSTVEDPHLNMSHGQSDQVIQVPQNQDEVYMGSLKAMLSNNVGNHIMASFLVGNQNMVSWEGILFDVGNNYVTIYQPTKGKYVVADLYALKFMEFFEPNPQATLTEIPRPNPWASSM